MRGNYPEEFKQLFGENRGCPRPWAANVQDMDLSPTDIPELDSQTVRVTAQDPEIRAHAKEILKKKGRTVGGVNWRLKPHPFLFKHRLRLCLTDRWHQLLGKKSHKRATCQQHLTCLVRTLTHDRTAFMESLNARQRKRLRTICTADPAHVLPFYHKMVYWENRKIVLQQEEQLRKSCLEGQHVREDEVFRFALICCSRCNQPGHAAAFCTG